MLDRTTAPPSKPLSSIKFAEFRKTFLSGGTPVVEVRDDSQPIVFLEIIFEGGRIAESKAGASYFAAKMLQEGTEKRSSHEISLGLESLGSFMEISSAMDFVSFKLYALKKNLKSSFAILEDLLLNPSFPSEEFELLKQIRSRNIDNLLARNSQYANLALSEKLFGEFHPYGRVLTSEKIKEVNLEEVKEHYKNRLFQDPKVIIGGDYPSSIRKRIDDLLSQLASGGKTIIADQTESAFGEHAIKKSGSTQASLRVGTHAITKDHPDIHKVSIANTLLGGYFGSRLMKKIREEKGLTYGIYSSLAHQKYKSYWQISAEVQKDKAEEARQAIEAEISKLSEEAPSDIELTTLKSYMIGKLQNSMDSIFSIAGLYKNLLLFEKGPDYLEEYMNAIQTIEGNEISDLVGKHFSTPQKVELLVS